MTPRMTPTFSTPAPRPAVTGRLTGRRTGHRTGRLGAAAAIGLTVGSALLVGATPASAAITGFPAAAYTSNTTITVQASVAQSATQSTLQLTDPSGASKRVAVATTRDVLGRYDATTLSYALTTTCEQADSTSCSGDHPAQNGTWVVQVIGDSTNTDTKQFQVDIAPRIPGGVSATATGPSQITVRWQPGTEPDLQQYAVSDGAGHVLRTVTAGSCGAQDCSTVFGYPSAASGARSFAVSATRSAPVEPGGSLSSPASSSQRAVLAGTAASPSADPSSAPSSTPTQEPSTGGAAGGSGQPGSGANPGQPGPGQTVGPTAGAGAGTTSNAGDPASVTTGPQAAGAALAARRAFATSFSSFEPMMGLNKLPPLPANDSPVAAGLPNGAYQPTLGYTDKTVSEPVPVPTTRTATRLSVAAGRGLPAARLASILAITLLLVLAGLHLRRLAGSDRPAVATARR